MDDFLSNFPELNGISPEKLEFIMNFANKDKPKNMNDAMPFLIANMNLAKKSNISFSDSEVRLIVEILTRDLPQEEQVKVKRITTMLRK